MLEEAKRRNDLTVLMTSSLLKLQVIITVQQASKARQCLEHQSQAEAFIITAELHHPESNQSDNENPPELQSSSSEEEVESMHQSRTEAILNAAEVLQPGYIHSDSEDLPELQSSSSEEDLEEMSKSPAGDKEQHNPRPLGKFWDSTDSDTPVATPNKEANATSYWTGLEVM